MKNRSLSSDTLSLYDEDNSIKGHVYYLDVEVDVRVFYE